MSNFWDYAITSDYGERIDPFTGQKTNHNGIDYALPYGTAIHSNVSGEVVDWRQNSDGYGTYVVIQDRQGKYHYYAHLDNTPLMEDERVEVGDIIGYSGSSGRSTGPHLHYEVRSINNKTTLNPSDFTTSVTIENYKAEDEKFEWWRAEEWKEKGISILADLLKWTCIILLIVLMVYFFYQSIETGGN